MFRFFSKHKSLSEKAQISIFFLAIMTTMIVITFITINIGKIAKDKTYSGNAADGGALAGASVSAYAFNYVANANKDEDEKLEGNWNDFKDVYDRHFDHADEIKDEFDIEAEKATPHACCSGTVCSTAPGEADEASRHAGRYKDQMNELIKNPNTGQANPDEDQRGQDLGVIPNYWKLQEDFYVAIRERVHDDQQGQNDLYQNALYAGYIFNLHNDGTSHRLGKINQKLWSAFLKGITVQSVQNGKPETFSYVDGAGRFHIVTAIVTIQAMRTYQMVETSLNRQTVTTLLETARELARTAEELTKTAASLYRSTCGCDSTSSWCSICRVFACDPQDISGDLLVNLSEILMDLAKQLADTTRQGLTADKAATSSSKNDTNGDIIKYIQDITHDRMVNSSDFQFHMGGPVKGMRGDIDVPNFYPPIQSRATASFRGQGSIHPQKPSHDAQLIMAN